jgi:DNA-binding MarR family transcriptional regulator
MCSAADGEEYAIWQKLCQSAKCHLAKNIAMWHKGTMTHIVKKTLSLSGMFYRRRDDWIKFVLEIPKAELSFTEKAIAIFIAEKMNPRDQSWVISQERIAKALGLKIRIVKSAVAKLKERGLIRTRRTRLNGKPKLFNAYEIVAVEDAEPL